MIHGMKMCIRDRIDSEGYLFVRDNFEGLGWYITVYLIGAFIRKYGNKKWDNFRVGLVGAIISAVVICISIYVFNYTMKIDIYHLDVYKRQDMEMLVYDYIMKNKNVVKYMTVRELADEVHVSTATVMRFCRKAGFDGYSEFKVKFKMYLEEETKKNKKNNEDVKEIQEYFYKIGSGIHQKELDEIAQVVRQADQVIFIGLGTSGILGKYGARFFSNLRKFSQYIEDPYFPCLLYTSSVTVLKWFGKMLSYK